MRAVATMLAVGAGILLGVVVAHHIDCTPWLASVKVCAITK